MPAGPSHVDELLQHGYRFALSLTHDPTRAEDLVHDAWLRLLAARAPFERAYLLKAVHTRFIDLFRRERRVHFEALPADVHGRNDDGADEILVDVENAELAGALARLLPEERAVLFLSCVSEWTTQQIAELLDWPRGTVMSVLHRVRLRLRQELTPAEKRAS